MAERGIADFFRRLGYPHEISQHELAALKQNHALAWAVRHLEGKHEPLDPAAVALFEDAEASGIIDQDATFNMAALMQQSVQLSAAKEQMNEWLPRPDAAQLAAQLAAEEAEITELELAREQMRAAKALLDKHSVVAAPGLPRSAGDLPSGGGPRLLADAASRGAAQERAGARAHDAAISAEAAQLEQLVAEIEGLLCSSAGSWLLCASDAEQLHALDSAFSAQQSRRAPCAASWHKPRRLRCMPPPPGLAGAADGLRPSGSGAPPFANPPRTRPLLARRLATLVSEQLTAPQRGSSIAAGGAGPRGRKAPLREHYQERMLQGLSLRQVDDLHAQLALLRRGSMLGGSRRRPLGLQRPALRCSPWPPVCRSSTRPRPPRPAPPPPAHRPPTTRPPPAHPVLHRPARRRRGAAGQAAGRRRLAGCARQGAAAAGARAARRQRRAARVRQLGGAGARADRPQWRPQQRPGRGGGALRRAERR
jgi:hypothetical protein